MVTVTVNSKNYTYVFFILYFVSLWYFMVAEGFNSYDELKADYVVSYVREYKKNEGLKYLEDPSVIFLAEARFKEENNVNVFLQEHVKNGGLFFCGSLIITTFFFFKGMRFSVLLLSFPFLFVLANYYASTGVFYPHLLVCAVFVMLLSYAVSYVLRKQFSSGWRGKD